MTQGPSRWRRALSLSAFVYLTSTIVVMASERAFWFWAGFSADSVLFLGVFYLIPTTAVLWAVALGLARQFHQIIMAGALYAIVTEGVLTPVIYADGPLLILAAMFVAWHGLIAFTGFWYLVRRWLLDRDRPRLVTGSLFFGTFWGVWALASAIGDPPDEAEAVESGFDLVVLDPVEFGRYALMVGVTLMAAHWLIGFVWPTGWRPGRRSTITLLVLSGAYFAVAVLPAVFWAPIKLAVMLGVTWRLLGRQSPAVEENMPTILDQMTGRVHLKDCAILVLMPVAASMTYALLWPLRSESQVLEIVYWGLVWTQVVVGFFAYIWAWRQSRPSAVRAERVVISAVG